jgi:hypothetical protein
MRTKIRSLALALLTSEVGVEEEPYNELYELMKLAGNCGDIMRHVEATDGNFYLPEGFEG